jgi:hypothetical protein
MNCFRFIKTVLDELYYQISHEIVNENQRDEAIRSRLEDLSEIYQDLMYTTNIDYSDPITRFAYIYRYTAAHANMVYQFIRDTQDLRNIFDRPNISVSCVGGGPGSDLLGVLKFMEREGKSARLMCRLYDREEAWGDSWEDVYEKLKSTFGMGISFRRLDVTEPVKWGATYNKLLETDLFTMIFFMSEVFSNKGDADSFFEYLFGNAKPGSFFLFVDNGSWNFYNWFDSLAMNYNLDCLNGVKYHGFQMEFDEEKTDLEPYYSKFKDPKLKGTITYRICRKV